MRLCDYHDLVESEYSPHDFWPLFSQWLFPLLRLINPIARLSIPPKMRITG